MRRGFPAKKFQREEAKKARRERKALRRKLAPLQNLKPWPFPDKGANVSALIRE